MRRVIPTPLIAIVLAACAATGNDQPTSDGDAPVGPGPGTTADAILIVEDGSAVTGPGIGVTEALGHLGGGPVLVNGALFIDEEGGVLLCEAIAESFPPQCGGARLEVQGLDPGGQLLEEANGVRWTEPAQLFGRVVAGN